MREIAIMREEEKVLRIPTRAVKPSEESQMRNGIQHPAPENAVMVPKRKTVMNTVLALELQLFRRRRVSVANIDKTTSPTAHHKTDITELTVAHHKATLSQSLGRNRICKGNTRR